MKETIKKIVPKSVITALGEVYDAMARTPQSVQTALHPWMRESRSQLEKLHNLHAGKRCFIIGNGPSLRQTDLSKLRNEYTIGMNRIFLAFPEMGFETNYLVSINDLVVEQSASELQSLKMPRFFSWRARKWLHPADDLYFLHTSYTGPRFAKDVRGRLWEGATVTYVAMQLAFYLGFETVVLIGVDHNFATQGKPNTTIVSQGDDPNHFNPGYFGKGFRWQLPDLETSERSYALARNTYAADGRQVLDATVGGKLTIFPKVNYTDLF